MISKAILALLFLSLSISQTISISFHDGIKSWCSQTPHPHACEYHMSQNPKQYFPDIKTTRKDFFKKSKELALDRFMHAQNNIYPLGTKCRNAKEKAAWADCVDLYKESIQKINNTFDPQCSSTDAQTWLSTTLTNLETCKQGFIDFDMTDYILPLVTNNNLTKLISNCLSLNNGSHDSTTSSSYKDGFPSWVNPRGRRLLQSSGNPRANLVVAQDGSGNYKTVSAAIAAAKSGNVIYVKQGVYRENVNVGKGLKNIFIYGDGIGKTIITGSKSVGGGSTTFNSATFAIVGDGFMARGITFRNTAGAGNHQAVALRSGSDLSVFYQCSFEGYQDTLYVYSDRQFYRECDIYGTVDFIFGNAAVVLQNCNIYPRLPPNKINTVTAQGRSDPNQNTGISIHNSRITAASDLRPQQGSVKTYLGRPWKQYSRTVVMKTSLDSLINAAGWYPWSGNFALNTLYYGEYANTGPGASTANRVTWKGFHVITSASVASQFTPGSFIAGGSWLPGTNVPFTSGL